MYYLRQDDGAIWWNLLSWLIKNSLNKISFFIRKSSVTGHLFASFFEVKSQNKPIAMKNIHARFY